MAIVDKYRNKLMVNKKNDSLQSGLQNNTTSLQSGLQENETEQLEKPNYANNTNNYGWQDYASMISAKTANSKAELQTAMQRAQSASNDYLKALGLQGSGMGQSQLTDIGIQYQNALSKINKTAQDDVNNQLTKDLEDAVASGRYSARDVQDFIGQYGEQTGNTESYKNIAENYGATYEQEADSVFEDLDRLINGDEYTLANKSKVIATEKQKLYATDLRNKLTEAYTNGNQDEFYRLLDENNNFLNTLDTTNTSSTTQTSESKTNKISDIPDNFSTIHKDNITIGPFGYNPISKEKWYRVGDSDIYFYRNTNDKYTVVANGTKTETDFNGLKKLINED